MCRAFTRARTCDRPILADLSLEQNIIAFTWQSIDHRHQLTAKLNTTITNRSEAKQPGASILGIGNTGPLNILIGGPSTDWASNNWRAKAFLPITRIMTEKTEGKRLDEEEMGRWRTCPHRYLWQIDAFACNKRVNIIIFLCRGKKKIKLFTISSGTFVCRTCAIDCLQGGWRSLLWKRSAAAAGTWTH